MFELKSFLLSEYKKRFPNGDAVRIKKSIELAVDYLEKIGLTMSPTDVKDAYQSVVKDGFLKIFVREMAEEPQTADGVVYLGAECIFGYLHHDFINFTTGEMRLDVSNGNVLFPGAHSDEAYYFKKGSVEFIEALTETSFYNDSTPAEEILKLSEFVKPDDILRLPSSYTLDLKMQVVRSFADKKIAVPKEKEQPQV